MKASRGEGFEWAYRDLLIALLVVFMAMAALAVLAAVKRADSVNQGVLMITTDWAPLDPTKYVPAAANISVGDADVDLWVKPPGEPTIGYAAMSGISCNLLRDDLGALEDPESKQEEIAVCRRHPAGEWVVNVVLYTENDAALPVPVTVKVLAIGAGGIKTMLEKTVALTYQGQELTVWRFTLDKKGAVVPGSVSDLPMALFRADGRGASAPHP